jgi:hypothetical protein
MNKVVMLIVLVAFVFIITYDPKKGKKFLPLETYKPFSVPDPAASGDCDESRYLQLQGLSGTKCLGHNKEYLGAVYESPSARADMNRVVGFELD